MIPAPDSSRVASDPAPVRRAAGVLLTGMMLAGILAAAPPLPEGVVLAPYDSSLPLEGQRPEAYYLSYETLDRLHDLASQNTTQPPPSASLLRATHRARFDGQGLQVHSRYHFHKQGAGPITLPFRFEGVEWNEPNSLPGPPLDPTGVLPIQYPGHGATEARYRVPVPKNAREITWLVPAALAGELIIETSPGGPCGFDLKGAPLWAQSQRGDTHECRAAVGERVEFTLIRSRPRVPPGAPPPAEAHVQTTLLASPGLEQLEVRCRFGFPNERRQRFRLTLDPSVQITGIDAPGLHDWRFEEPSELLVVLSEPLEAEAEITLHGERPLAPGANRSVPQFTPSAAKLDRTFVLTASAPGRILPEAPPRFRPIPHPEIDGASQVHAFSETGSGSPLTYEIDFPSRLVSVDARYYFELDPNRPKTILQATLEGAEPWSSLRLRLPPGHRVETVRSPALRDAWPGEDSLDLRFDRSFQGPLPLLLVLSRDPSIAQRDLALESVGFPESFRLEGEALVTAPFSQSWRSTLPEGENWVTAPPADVLSSAMVHSPMHRAWAFRFDGPFTVNLQRSYRPARFTAASSLEVRLETHRLLVESRIQLEVEEGLLGTVVVDLPPAWSAPTIEGPGVRSVSFERRENGIRGRIQFQRPSANSQSLELRGHLDWNRSRARLEAPVWPEAVSESSQVRLSIPDHPRLQVIPDGLERVGSNGSSALPAPHHFRSAYPDWSLELEALPLVAPAGSGIEIPILDLESAFLQNGDEWHRASLRVVNHDQSFLTLQLPSGAKLLDVSLADRPLPAPPRAGSNDAILIPIPRHRPGDPATRIQLVYRVPREAIPAETSPFAGERAMNGPAVPGASVDETFWSIRLPEDHDFHVKEGNLWRLDATAWALERSETHLAAMERMSRFVTSSRLDESARIANAREILRLGSRIHRELDAVQESGAIARQESLLRETAALEKIARDFLELRLASPTRNSGSGQAIPTPNPPTASPETARPAPGETVPRLDLSEHLSIPARFVMDYPLSRAIASPGAPATQHHQPDRGREEPDHRTSPAPAPEPQPQDKSLTAHFAPGAQTAFFKTLERDARLVAVLPPSLDENIRFSWIAFGAVILVLWLIHKACRSTSEGLRKRKKRV